MRIGLITLLVGFTFLALAQELIPVGTWRTHYSYESTQNVEQVGERIFASTPVSLIFYDPSDNSLNPFSKVDGLSDVGISTISYYANQNELAVGYDNGNLDLITDEEIINMPVLKNRDLIYSKRILDVSFYQETLNLSTEFGVLVINRQNGSVVESYETLGPNGEVTQINNSVFVGDLMFLASASGVLTGDRSSDDNLQDFNNWERYEGSPVFGEFINSVVNFNETVYAAGSSEVYYLSGDQWLAYNSFLQAGEEITKITGGSTKIMVLTDQDHMYTLDGAGGSERVDLEDGDRANDMIQTGDTYWYADQGKGLSQWMQGSVFRYVLNGPFFNIDRLGVAGEKIHAFPELDDDIFDPVSNGLGYNVFENGTWTTVEPEDIGGLDNISDVVIVDDKTYISSFGGGVFEVSQNVIFDHNNSELPLHNSLTGNVLVTGMYENQGVLWFSAMGDDPLVSLDTEGTWNGYAVGSFTQPTDILVHPFGYIWMSMGFSPKRGLIVANLESDRVRQITSTNSSLPSETVYDITFDIDGEVWIATAQGVAYYPSSFGVIEDTLDVIIPRFDNGYLFEREPVRAITIDGGNRKWMATENGAWLFEDGVQDVVHHFTTENSPLPSDNVQDIVINHETGEVFFLTDLGIVSYRGDATVGLFTHHNVKIFPNPVLPNYQGLVGFDGLAYKSRLKITTVSGRLVREINSAGAGASWDLSDYNGRRVNGGIYMVFSSSPDGTDTFVGKIAVLD